MKHPGGSAYPQGHAIVDATGVVVEGVPGRQIRIVSALITCDSDGGSFQFTDSADTPNVLSGEHLVGAGAVLPFHDLGWFADAAKGEDLEVTISGNVVIDLNYALI